MNTLALNIEKEISRHYRGLLRDYHKHSGFHDQKRIRKALEYAIENSSGHHVLHVIQVARIIARDMGMGSSAVIGALLIPEAKAAKSDRNKIQKLFGDEVAGIVESLVNISGIDTSKTSLHIESFKKLILTLAGDIQVLLIIIADRLQLMRSMENSSKERQQKLASESFNLYASLAHRLGLYSIKSELEDISMMYLEPEQYSFISEKLANTTRKRNRFIREFIKPVKEKLDKLGVEYEVKGRLKSVHSIWNKMKVQEVEFEEVYDLFAIRIIIDSDQEHERALCWQVYSVITDLYTPNPNRLRDWISIPKANGYESLHTTVVTPKGRWVEVQIRSRRMNEYAEKGMAAHWMYKGSSPDKLMDKWLARMRDALEEPEADSKGLMDNVKLSLSPEEIFVFTPKGDLKRLSAGATLLDFAFEIHSDVGAKCTGGRVNHKNVTLKHKLKNGDMVEVMTSKNQRPKQDWLSFVVCSKSKNRIKISLNEEKQKTSEIGKEILKRRLRNWKISFDDHNVKKLLKHYGLKYARDLYYRISEEKIDLMELKAFLLKEEQPVAGTQPDDNKEKKTGSKTAKTSAQEDFLIIENKVENIDYKLSACCKPRPGDRIFGFVTIKDGIKVHRMDCPNARQMIRRYPYRVIQTKWTESASGFVLIYRLKVSGRDEMGLVNRITEIISQDKELNMQSVNFSSKDGSFSGEIVLLVRNNSYIEGLTRRLLSIKGVQKVSALAE